MKDFSSFEELSSYAATFGVDSRGFHPSELSLSKGIIKIPLQPTAGRTRVKCLKVICPQKGKKMLIGLLWHALFGKRFKVVHNLIFFEMLNSIKKWDPLAQIVFDVMMILNSTTKVGSSNQFFHHNLVCVKRSTEEFYLQELILRLELAGVKLPHKAPDLDSFLLLSESYILLKRPVDPVRIGVGYKDKGSLSLPGNEYDPDEITPYSEPTNELVWQLLLKNFSTNKPSMKL